ncbi:ribosome small subunit-dependent GTPase A [Alicyclobacillus shizuokensis]|uniref:ribosome small subunit-dependent GTPase A n=1 Tax=Alicyclobacillus shizuokensis TaxID=392014 RepID=UPI00082A52AE|nr:ribosome small subunit-dependent GTPase A [Alicyclobacillus shizuokensis]
MPDGIVVRGRGGFFDVVGNGGSWRCRARGVFRKRGVNLLVGDRVRLNETGAGEGVITEVLPRETELVRPPIANADQALLVFSVRSPDFQAGLLDRTLVAVAARGLRPVVVLSKADLMEGEAVAALAVPYRQAGYPVHPVSSRTKQGLDPIWSELMGHITVFAGPSGAGKSSLANAIDPQLGLQMGDISDKLRRGRHTTRHVELFRISDATYIADAPGFSQLDLDVEAAQLRLYFPEFQVTAGDCAYRGCLHVDEQDCGVKRAVAAGLLASTRYESYCHLYQELKQKEARRY